MSKNRSVSASAGRSKSQPVKSKNVQKTGKKSNLPVSKLNGKRRLASASPAPTKKSTKTQQFIKKTKKSTRTPSPSPVRTPMKGGRGKKADPVPEKKRKGNTGKSTQPVVILSDSEDNATPRKKKASKLEEKAASRPGNATPIKGGAAAAANNRGRSVTPVKITKKKVVQVPLPEDIAEAVMQIVSDNKGAKLTAPRILQLAQEAYIGANEVLVYTAVGNLFRTGLLTENKGAYVVDADVLNQLKPPAPVVEEEPVPAVVVAEEAPVVDATEVEAEAIEVEAPAVDATGSAHRSAAKEEAASVKKSAAKEDAAAAVASAKKSVARETSESARKSASKAEASAKKSTSKTSAKKADDVAEDAIVAEEVAAE